MDINDVKRTAHLARIELTEAECDSLNHDFKKILSYIEKLNELQLDQTEPASHPFELKNVFREDEVKTPMGAKPLMEISPEHHKDMICVPQVIETKS